VPTGPNSEWDVFHLQIVNGGPLAGDINANWNIVMNYTLSAPVFFDQVAQVQVPSGVATGSQSLILTTAQGASPPFTVNVVAVQPGLLAPPSFNLGGTQYAVALFSDGTTYVLPPGAIAGINSRRARPGETITLYGIGFGSVTPNIPPGQIATQVSTLTMPLSVAFGVTQAATPLPYDGLAPNYVGLYQINVVVPNIGASDAEPLTFSLGGTGGTQRLSLAVGN
jgi:uncharacterized protein (TIGR03437 family)